MNNALSDFIFQSKYSRYNPALGRKETFEESVNRIELMHMTFLGERYPHVFTSADFTNDFIEAMQAYREGKVYGSQRGLQFGGEPILKKHARLFNCSFTYVDRLEVFKQIEWVLLCGCGVGLSVERKHVDQLPKMVESLSSIAENVVIDDSIEGWSNAFDKLISYYFIEGASYPKFDYSEIRPKGSLISGGFLAPGPDGLRNSINKVRDILDKVYKTTKKLSPINCTDIISHEADSVLSGGVRRSALAILFSPDDEEMFNAKTGNWFYDNPQRGRFNASAALERDTCDKEVFDRLFKSSKEYGEPGFFFRSHEGLGCNPCFEVGFVPKTSKTNKTGFQFCNLVTISGKEVVTEEDFYTACKHASTIATIQAAYQDFPFLGEATEELVKEDPLIGVSIGGIMMNQYVLLNPEVLRKGSEIVKTQNSIIAKLLGIKEASRTCVVKPDGSFGTLTGNSPGCHGAHSRRYIRRVQVNKEEEAGKIYKSYNPKSVVESVWSNNHTDDCIMFAIEEPENAVFKSDLLGINQLEIVKTLYNNWIVPGNRDEHSAVQNNVSNTVIVPEGQWDKVRDYIWDNRYYLAGVSFIAASGDLDYTQPPYTEVLFPSELLEKYGEGIIFASGLIVDAEKVFGNLWKACDTFNGLGEKLYSTTSDAKNLIKELNVSEDPSLNTQPHSKWVDAKKHQYNNWYNLLLNLNYSEEFIEELLDNDFEIPVVEVKKYLDKTMFSGVKNLNEKRDIMRRMKKYGDKYFNSDYRTMLYALKSVQLYHDWCDITMNYTPIDWTKVKWENVTLNADEMAGASCSGGACDITKL